jgi:ribose 5-phosphate isomerase A
MISIDDHKNAAANAAIEELPTAGIIGLGTGSTVGFFLEALRRAIASGRRFVGVPSSAQTRAHATTLGIPLLDDDGPWDIAVTVDGADEVDPDLDMIKGGGGAHTREKIVSSASAKTVIIVDEAKLVRRLGERRPIPIEVLAFGHSTLRARLERFGLPTLRERAGTSVRTDAGNLIYDLEVELIADPRELDAALRALPGVVETGLFVQRADVVLVGSSRGVERRVRVS